jgi:hypothetical protein
MIGREAVSAYRLETRVLPAKSSSTSARSGKFCASELPGGITATLDEWSKNQ